MSDMSVTQIYRSRPNLNSPLKDLQMVAQATWKNFLKMPLFSATSNSKLPTSILLIASNLALKNPSCPMKPALKATTPG